MIFIVKMLIKDPNYLIGLMAMHGFNRYQYAHHIGISVSFLSYILTRKRTPSPKTARKIAKGVGKTIPDLFLCKMLSKDSKKMNKNG